MGRDEGGLGVATVLGIVGFVATGLAASPGFTTTETAIHEIVVRTSAQAGANHHGAAPCCVWPARSENGPGLEFRPATPRPAPIVGPARTRVVVVAFLGLYCRTGGRLSPSPPSLVGALASPQTRPSLPRHWWPQLPQLCAKLRVRSPLHCPGPWNGLPAWTRRLMPRFIMGQAMDPYRWKPRAKLIRPEGEAIGHPRRFYNCGQVSHRNLASSIHHPAPNTAAYAILPAPT